VVDAALAEMTASFEVGLLHSVCLYGSIPRGTALSGRSDLDLLIALRAQPVDVDRDRAHVIEAVLD
jgi:predicted nucleotidyltransferase